MKIRALPTMYSGVEFRSRLEARWAVYFDTIGIKWEYELQGYELPAGWYLPDFWLPQVDLFAEVKPCELTAVEMLKVSQLVAGTDRGCLLLCGSPRFSPVPLVEPCGGVTDAVISMYHGYPLSEGRFYANTGCEGDDFESCLGRLFDDMPKAVSAARSAKF
jgi:hypothetical protein